MKHIYIIGDSENGLIGFVRNKKDLKVVKKYRGDIIVKKEDIRILENSKLKSYELIEFYDECFMTQDEYEMFEESFNQFLIEIAGISIRKFLKIIKLLKFDENEMKHINTLKIFLKDYIDLTNSFYEGDVDDSPYDEFELYDMSKAAKHFIKYNLTYS